MDKKIKDLLKKETKRQDETIDLIASENIASDDIMEILGTPLINKYSEGYPGRRYYPGNEVCDEIEKTAKEYALKAFSLDEKEWGANVQPYSGSPANLAILFALAKPKEKIMGMKLAFGGHLTHGHSVSATGVFWKAVQYETDKKTGLIDYKKIRALAIKNKPKVIISGTTAYPRQIDFKEFGDIAREVGAYHMADVSHIAGLIAGGEHMSPFPYADAVMMTTHKSLRGPRGAVIFGKKEKAHDSEQTIMELIDKAVFPGLQGGPHNNQTAAIAQAFYETLTPGFKRYAKQIIKNARCLAEELKKKGFDLISGGTDNHLILMNVKTIGLTGTEAEKRLEKNGIIANRNSIPGDESPFKPSGVRLGVPSVTTRGMKEEEMIKIADIFEKILIRNEDASREVKKITKEFSISNDKD